MLRHDPYALICLFWTFPSQARGISDAIIVGDIHEIEGLVTQKGGRRKYRNTLPTIVSKETVSFLDKFINLDPRDRPSPQELLQD